ncbi:hypothetical protein FHX48_002605 [Microbacterium halimionae]|uniref:Uncharacterized protein n=1 Tax=Microbacterium halimionae TaxID=1526413 RepID=A0A7W3PMD5_9MICO|nr:hypothetical protein [Microbacterium halimionae]MBA8817500.1 hypothetical protein [Microbacterium halimionae]NII95057.1 hypothetical protein [Microbacterium halimionae]
MQYKLMNASGASWPFWAEDGVCGYGDPVLPPELEAEVTKWVAQFEQHFDDDEGWPDKATAIAHRAEGERLLLAIDDVLPADIITLDYWETAHRTP